MMVDFQELKKQAKWDDDVRRRSLACKYIDYYRNNQVKYLIDKIGVLYPNEKDVLSKYAVCYGLTHAMIDDMALVFQTPADIMLDPASDAQTEKLAQIMDESRFHRTMIQADRYTELTKKVGVCPRWHTERGYIVLDLITPDRCIVTQDPQDHTKAIEVKYLISELENTPMRGETAIWAVWTDDEYREERLNQNGAPIETIKVDANPYKRIPIAWFTTNSELDEFWPDEGNSIVDANEWVNIRLTNMQLTLDYQSFSTLVTSGMPESQTIPVGVTHRINIPPGGMTRDIVGDAKYITPSPMLTEMWEIINQYITNIARLNGLSAQSFNRDSSQFSSGYQLKLSKQDIISRNMLKREFYREAVRELVKLMLECYSINNNFRFPVDAEIGVDFAEIQYDTNPIEDEQINAMKLSNGTTDRVTILMDENPDLTVEAAEARIAEIDERKKAAKPAAANDLDEALGL